ncbi:capsular polysaccharide export protein, LipB/KpsS family [Providencia hangzhouensis]|uniref:capsular polysaccharide export protein, LipB/KpsS family n=1 Tax=Providencia TaxID=586 RepID=UPI0024A00F4C|nr:hypothetical protein [Providencia sp. CIM-Carb-044]ELR5074091.1 hypothetical protein [Providencia stuartii]MDX7425543.1 hypothetical protein [Providencia sp. CIM-Carb-044]
MKTVFFFIYSPFRINLYNSILKEYKKLGYDSIIITQDLFSYLFFKKEQIATYLLRMKKTPPNTYKCEVIKNSIDIKSEHFSYEIGLKLAYNFDMLLHKLKIKDNDIVFSGNGYHIQDFLLLELKKNINFKIYFSELSNLDGKTFFDTKGTNASSSFYKHAETFFNKEVTPSLNEIQKEKLIDWKKNYILKKECSHIVKQAKKMGLLKLIQWRLYNLIELVFKIPSFSMLKYKSRKKGILRNKSLLIPSTEVNLNYKYYFLPLQVTDDSQIKINSNYDNSQAIDYFLKQAELKNKRLVIKFHPAEKNSDFIKNIIEKSKERNIIISTENTFLLMKNSDKVCVINSTAGFEAILLDKEVEFLGKSFYRYLISPHLLYYYLFDYLFDIDFFSGDNYENDIVEKLERLYER